MTALDKNSMLALLQGGTAPTPNPVPAAPAVVEDVFTGLGSAFTSKKSMKLPLGRHVCKIENVLMKASNKGTFFIVEIELLQTDVAGIPLGKGYALLTDPTKKTKFQPWLKGLIRAILHLDYSADSEARLVAEGADIGRAATTHGILNGKVFGVNNVAAVTEKLDPATGKGFPYIRQDWFAAEA